MEYCKASGLLVRKQAGKGVTLDLQWNGVAKKLSLVINLLPKPVRKIHPPRGLNHSWKGEARHTSVKLATKAGSLAGHFASAATSDDDLRLHSRGENGVAAPQCPAALH